MGHCVDSHDRFDAFRRQEDRPATQVAAAGREGRIDCYSVRARHPDFVMSSGQQQEASDGSIAVQSGGNTTINQGLSAEEVKSIVKTLADQLPAYTAAANQLINERLTAFEEKVLSKFANPPTADASAFKQPDFLYLLGQAQHAYARSGDDVSCDVMIDLIAERSKQDQRNRLQLSLNAAVEKVPLLTIEEFAELSLAFYLRRTIRGGYANLDEVAAELNGLVVPLAEASSAIGASYEYLVALGCATLSPFSMKLMDVLARRYAGLISKGRTKAQLTQTLPAEHKSALDNWIIPCTNNPDLVQLKAVNERHFLEVTKDTPLTELQRKAAWNSFADSTWTEEEFLQNMKVRVPGLEGLFEKWANSNLPKLEPTAIGIAIAYGNLSRMEGFKADLSIWIS